MTGRAAILGSLIVVFALAFTAIAAGPAFAAGTTGFTCKQVVSGSFTDPGCSSEGSGIFGHVSYKNGTSTETTGGATTETLLKTVTGGVTLSLKFPAASGTGTATNSEVGGEMIATGTGTITLGEGTVTAPAGKGCSLSSSTITTKELKGTTAGQGMFVKLEPASGSVLATFTVTGCSVTALNKEYKVEGSIKGLPTGIGIIFTHTGTTEQGTFTVGGQKAGLSGSISLLATDTTAGDTAVSPLALTT